MTQRLLYCMVVNISAQFSSDYLLALLYVVYGLQIVKLCWSTKRCNLYFCDDCGTCYDFSNLFVQIMQGKLAVNLWCRDMFMCHGFCVSTNRKELF